MKLSFKFFVWQIDFKTKKLDEEEKIKFLANELIKSVQASGRVISHPDVSKGFASFMIYIHNFDKESAEVDIDGGTNVWRISTKPTFKTLEVAK